MLVKLLDVRDVWEAKGPEAALRYLAKLPNVCGAERDAVGRGAEALVRPDFYRQLGADPDALVASGIAAVRRLITPTPVPGDSPMTDSNTAVVDAVVDAPAATAPKAPKAKAVKTPKAAKPAAPKAKPAGKPATKTEPATRTVGGEAVGLAAKSKADCKWTPLKVEFYKALKKCGGSATPKKIADKSGGKLDAGKCRHFGYHGIGGGYVRVEREEGVAGYIFTLTAKGQKVDPEAELKKQVG